MELPTERGNSKKGLINIKNKDDECFRWCHVRHLNLQEKDPQRINPSFTKLYDTHTFYQGLRGEPRSYLKTLCPYEHGIWQSIRDTFESLRNAKVVYIVFTWLP